ERRFSGRTRFPSPVNPHPLIRITPDNLFQRGMNALRIRRLIAGHFNWRIEPEHIAASIVIPEREPWNNLRSGVMRQLCEGRTGTSKAAEKIDEDALARAGVLIDQDADGF